MNYSAKRMAITAEIALSALLRRIENAKRTSQYRLALQFFRV
jgi:hypothetical protein